MVATAFLLKLAQRNVPSAQAMCTQPPTRPLLRQIKNVNLQERSLQVKLLPQAALRRATSLFNSAL